MSNGTRTEIHKLLVNTTYFPNSDELLVDVMMYFHQTQQNVNTVLELFSHPRRRSVLRGLRMHENPMALADLADEVAIQENEPPLPEISTEEVKRIYLTLYHTHVPKLADEQFIQYDQERDSVALAERSEDIEQYQELLMVN